MRILALEPYYGGSHRAFLDGWRRNSVHEFTVLGLPAHKWKWRMRHAAVTLAGQLGTAKYRKQSWDVLWVGDMLNLAEFVGLAPISIQQLPRVAYFHENQLTYPVRSHDERDLHYAFTNFVTALTADQTWFNSEFHRDDFFEAMDAYMSRMPDHQPLEELKSIEQASAVQHPGVEVHPIRVSPDPGPLRICWNSRWEHDKNPEDFFAALRILASEAIPFRVIVMGQAFRDKPTVFETAREEFAQVIDHWGFAAPQEYRRILATADVVVSTANHEFFGIGVVEGMAAGVVPVVPNRLAYTGVLRHLGLSDESDSGVCDPGFLYDGTVAGLARKLRDYAASVRSERFSDLRAMVQQASAKLAWSIRASEMDDAIELLASTKGRQSPLP